MATNNITEAITDMEARRDLIDEHIRRLREERMHVGMELKALREAERILAKVPEPIGTAPAIVARLPVGRPRRVREARVQGYNT